jgi:hypothetical protein
MRSSRDEGVGNEAVLEGQRSDLLLFRVSLRESDNVLPLPFHGTRLVPHSSPSGM